MEKKTGGEKKKDREKRGNLKSGKSD